MTVYTTRETKDLLSEFCRARGFKVSAVVDRVLADAVSNPDALARKLIGGAA